MYTYKGTTFFDYIYSPKKEESVKIKKIETHVISLVERIYT